MDLFLVHMLKALRFSESLFNAYVQEWSYLRGGLTTLDRDYGWINNIHHDIGTHVVHHLFPQIPHYHLIEAVSIYLLWFNQKIANFKSCNALMLTLFISVD